MLVVWLMAQAWQWERWISLTCMAAAQLTSSMLGAVATKERVAEAFKIILSAAKLRQYWLIYLAESYVAI